MDRIFLDRILIVARRGQAAQRAATGPRPRARSRGGARRPPFGLVAVDAPRLEQAADDSGGCCATKSRSPPGPGRLTTAWSGPGAAPPNPRIQAATRASLTSSGASSPLDADDQDVRLEAVVFGGEIGEQRGERPAREVGPVARERFGARGLPVPGELGRPASPRRARGDPSPKTSVPYAMGPFSRR